MARLVALALIASGCDLGAGLVVDPAWPEGEPAIVIVTDAGQRVLSVQLIEPPAARFAVEIRDSVIVYARTFEKLGERDLRGCRLENGGEQGEPLGDPSGAWTSGPVSLEDGIQLEEEEYPPRGFPLRLLDCEVELKPCEMLAQQLEVPPTRDGLSSVATISDSELIAMGGQHSDEDQRSILLRAENGVARALEPIDELSAFRGHVDDDGTGIVGAAYQTIFRLDYQGRLVASSTVAFEVVGASTGFDGTTMFVGKDGELFAISRGTLELRAIETPVYGVLPEPDQPKIAVVREGVFLLYGPDEVLYLYDGGYRELFTDPIDAIAADERFLLAAPEDGASVLIFDRETGEWSVAGQLFLAARPKNAASFGDGRFIVAGQGGVTGYFNGERLCSVVTGVDRNIEDLDIAPSGRVIFGAGDVTAGPFSPPVLLRFTFP